MYLVTVHRADNGETVDSRDFAFGTFAEIGFFLDHYGYNDSDFRVEIRFA